MTDPHLNEDGEVEVPQEVVNGKSKELFGEKIYTNIEVVDEVVASLEEGQAKQKQSIKHLAKNITESFSGGFDNLRESFDLNKGQTNQLKKSVNTAVEDIINEKHLTLSNQVKDLEKELESKKQEAEIENDASILQTATEQYEEEKQKIETSFTEEINQEVEKTINTVVEEQIEKVEEKKKKTTEDDVRDHLRGFSRTIPAFLMAYVDDDTTLANFEENIHEETFEELTSITIDEFKQLRDGFEYVDEHGETKVVQGLFNEVVFNASIQEFLETKNRLADYFDENLEEDIFDYIPPQKTNQIFTPKRMVQLMVDTLEKENPGIFSDKTMKFADLYAKSGLYITEIVKKLNNGLQDEIPNEQERIKWILENQVYACAPSHIIYHIVKNFIYSDMSDVSLENLIELDTLVLAREGKLSTEIYQAFGDDELKFDVIIGNPPYQENDNGKRDQDAGRNASASPLYHKFVLSSMEISNIQCFIIPTRWAFGAGKGLKDFSRTMLNDEHIQSFVYYQNSKAVFPDNDIKGGVSYFSRNEDYVGEANITIHTTNGKKIQRKDFLNTANSGKLIVYNEMGTILKKVIAFEGEDFDAVSKVMSNRNPYGLSTDFFRNPQKYDISAITDEKENTDDIRVYGLGKGQKRIHKYISRNEPMSREKDSIDTWKVFSPYAYGNGSLGERIPNPFVGEAGDIVTETFLRFGSFDHKFEAESLLKYIKTKFFRLLVSILKVTQHSTTTYRYVPLQDFSENSDIDWTKPVYEIDQKLYEKYGLTDEEIAFVEENVAEMN